MKLTVCELFAGVGGFRLGLEKSGWQTVWANQYEPSTKKQHAAECYIKKFSSKNFINEDIDKVDPKKIPKHTLLVGGFPCQDYSVATSQAKGIRGKKGVLWWNILKIVQAKKPPYILLENVDRLLGSPSKQRGRDFGVILACLRDEGYTVEWRMINAADYGFPQKRRRTFIFACKNNTKIAKRYLKAGELNNPSDWFIKESFFAKEFPVKLKNEQQIMFEGLSFSQSKQEVSDKFKFKFSNAGFMTKEEAIYDIPVVPLFNKKFITLRDILEKNVDKKYYIDESQIGKSDLYKGKRVAKKSIPDTVKKSWKYVKGAKHEIRETAAGYKFNYDEGPIPFPDNLDSPSRTMLTSEGSKSPNRISHIIKDPETKKHRVLTPVECEKLNGFNKNWTKSDDKGNQFPDSKRYFFMGNALVVGLVEKIGKRLVKVLDES
jgi:DNA (cytosine-5)-methyltransferase 1